MTRDGNDTEELAATVRQALRDERDAAARLRTAECAAAAARTTMTGQRSNEQEAIAAACAAADADAEIAAAWAARLAAKVRADEAIKRLATLREETNP